MLVPIMVGGFLFTGRKCVQKAVFFFLAAATAHGQARITINVTDPRPLAKASEQLEKVLHVPVNYEDVPYEHASDIQDLTAQVARNAPANAKGLVIIPRGGSISMRATMVPGRD